MLTRGKLAKKTGCNIETIRYYEKIGLLPDPARTTSGYRIYKQEHVKRLHFIQRAKGLGFSAERIRKLLNLADGTEHTRAEVKSLTQTHIDEISEKIRDLQKLKRKLKQISSRCDGADESVEGCPILVSLVSDR